MYKRFKDASVRTSLIRLFLGHLSSLVSVVDMKLYGGDIEGFRLMSHYMDVDYDEIPVHERLDVAMRMLRRSRPPGPDVVRAALGSSPLNPTILTAQDERGTTILHAVALRCGRIASDVIVFWENGGGQRLTDTQSIRSSPELRGKSYTTPDSSFAKMTEAGVYC